MTGRPSSTVRAVAKTGPSSGGSTMNGPVSIGSWALTPRTATAFRRGATKPVSSWVVSASSDSAALAGGDEPIGESAPRPRTLRPIRPA